MKVFHASLIAAVLLVAMSSYAATTSPGKTSSFASGDGGLDGVGDIPPLTAQILKGKSKTVIKIDASVSTATNAVLVGDYLDPSVNGYPLMPSSYIYGQCSATNGAYCTLTATFWMDVDAAELAHPGVYVGQPLNVTLQGGNSATGGAGIAYFATLSVTVVKK